MYDLPDLQGKRGRQDLQDLFLFSQFPPARHRLRLQARRAGMKLRKTIRYRGENSYKGGCWFQNDLNISLAIPVILVKGGVGAFVAFFLEP